MWVCLVQAGPIGPWLPDYGHPRIYLGCHLIDAAAGTRGVWLAKTDRLGAAMGTKPFGGINHDRGRFVQQTSDGGNQNIRGPGPTNPKF